MLCTQVLKGNVECNSPLLPVYSCETGWILFCSRCHNTSEILSRSEIDISEEIGEEIWTAVSNYDDCRYDDAVSRFTKLEAVVGSKWKTACSWHRILSQYGFVYDYDDSSWTMCRYPILKKEELQRFNTDSNTLVDSIHDPQIKRQLTAQLDYFRRNIEASINNTVSFDVFIDWDVQTSSISSRLMAEKITMSLSQKGIRAYIGEGTSDGFECGYRYAKGFASQLMLAIVESQSITENTRFFHELKAYDRNRSTRIIYYLAEGVNRSKLPGFMETLRHNLMPFNKDSPDVNQVVREIESELIRLKGEITDLGNDSVFDVTPIRDFPTIDYNRLYLDMRRELDEYCRSHNKKPDKDWFRQLYHIWDESHNPKIGILILLYLVIPMPDTDYQNGKVFYRQLSQMFPEDEDVQGFLTSPEIKVLLGLQ